MYKLALTSLPKHNVPLESHFEYENHRKSSDALRHQKIEEALRMKSTVSSHKAEEDFETYKKLEEKNKQPMPLDPHNVVDQGIIEMHGHIFVETGLLNKGVGSDKSVDHEMDDNISFIKSQTAPLEKIAKAAVTPYQQETKWTCSAACLKAVLNFYGFKISEKECGVYIRVRKNKGAETTDIVNAAKAIGFNAYEKSFTVEEVKALLEKDIPIICDIQSFTKPGAGHYVVLVGFEDGQAILMDPNVEGNQRKLSARDFFDRWFDYEMKAPHKLMKHWGVVVEPK